MLQVRSAVEETPAATLAAVLIPNLIRSQVLHAFTFIVALIIPKVLQHQNHNHQPGPCLSPVVSNINDEVLKNHQLRPLAAVTIQNITTIISHIKAYK